MDHTTSHNGSEPAIDEVRGLPGATVLEFGASWCGWCRAAQPLIASALQAHPTVRHIKIEDGRGKPLGRHYRVKLWPTLIFLKDGAEQARVTRPSDSTDLISALDQLELS